eukprot:gene561-biopygen7121
MCRIPWTDMVSNEKVLDKVKEKIMLLTTVFQRQLRFAGHVVREDGLEKLVLEGKIEDVNARGRQRKVLSDDLALKAGNLKKGELLYLAQDSKRVRRVVANVSV